MDETQQAIARIKRGDLTGLEGLVRQHQTKAVYAAYLVLQDRPAAEDVVQNVFLRVVERIRQYDESRPFEPWFLRNVIHDITDPNPMVHCGLLRVLATSRRVSAATTIDGAKYPSMPSKT